MGAMGREEPTMEDLRERTAERAGAHLGTVAEAIANGTRATYAEDWGEVMWRYLELDR